MTVCVPVCIAMQGGDLHNATGGTLQGQDLPPKVQVKGMCCTYTGHVGVDECTLVQCATSFAT